MKKLILLSACALMFVACGNKTGGAATDADSTAQEVTAVPDSLNNVEAVIKQVKAVYAYFNNRKDGDPWLDAKFGSKEWQKTIAEVVKVDEKKREQDSEEEGFFVNEFDPWTFGLLSDTLSPENINAKLLENGMAEASFTLKGDDSEDNVCWWLKVEDGQWRVQTIFNADEDLLADMYYYLDEQKFLPTFDISKYLASMQKQADFPIRNYALYDFDHDGTPEVIASGKDTTWEMAAFSIADGKPTMLLNSFKSAFYVFGHGLGVQESCGTGCHTEEYCIVKNSRKDFNFGSFDQYDMEGNLIKEESSRYKGDKEISDEELGQLKKQLGAWVRIGFDWHKVQAPADNGISDYAE